MKKIIAISLALVFILMSFASCGENTPATNSTPSNSTGTQTPDVTLVDCNVAFNKSEKGMPDYTSTTEFTLNGDTAFETMTEDYLYLPQGAVISSEKEFGIYTFGKDFNLNQAIMQSAGFSTREFDPTFKTGSATLKETCYVRISVKGTLADIKIQVPQGTESTVMCGAEEILKFQEDINLANNFYRNSAANVNYIFLTDIHSGSEVSDRDSDGNRDYDPVEEVNAKRDNYINNYLDKVVAIVNTSPYIDFVVIGGDIVNGYETPDSLNYQENKKKNPNLTVSKHLVLQHQEILAPFKKCTKPVFITAGNHDDNNGHSIYSVDKKDGWLLSDLDWDKGVFREFINVDVVRDSNYSYNGKSISKYYYYDLEKSGKTTRIICLDYNDDRFTFDSKGEVTAQPNWGEYHEGQLNWLASTALQGDFDECIMFSHATFVTSRGDTLDRILEAYQTKDRVKMPGLSVDYSNRTSGDILVYHHGHEHDHERTFEFTKRFWRLESPMMVTAINLVSVGSENTTVRALDKAKPIVYELLRNGTENQTIQ